ncbi:MAG: NAD(P)/FAD-dependent oxidoreductase [Okeania sp. SIO3I5]|uniref:NAD(P)/FAD-dependent oxidoreductase n=1 Tax=Okeania sp. SIO3I5 TaxID=2607805 RepID=UPI0013B8C61F|nr:NAD(P)/FAD-dependent oxidoreductase [Okeania sp. SIO3I5]NEQ40622.1 NAD(P)/FAD-dependent oxidoreductase [Okeania sp. SIO3I5]
MSLNQEKHQSPHHVVIVGGGFAGLEAAKQLGKAPVKVTLVDKRNFHLFQPLLYQVATGSLSPGDIASPLRGVVAEQKNTHVIMGEVVDVDPEQKKLILRDQELDYDTLVLATGVSHNYFGNDWSEKAPGLKTVENALEMRRRIFASFEAAEKEPDSEKRKALLTFAIVGAGPTGVELAGALAELAHTKLKEEYRSINTSEAQIYLIQSGERVLPSFKPALSEKARIELEKLGVNVMTKTRVTNIENNVVTVRSGETTTDIPAHTILWGAGVKASAVSEAISNRTGAELDRAGRVFVNEDLTIPGHPEIFVIGDLANFSHQGDSPVPGVAPAAMQEGVYVAKLIRKRLQGQTLKPFHYIDYGSLAVIGRHQAVVQYKAIRFSGPLAWFSWLFIHIYYMIEFDNQLIVMIQWAWSYFTGQGGARLITEKATKTPTYEECQARYTPLVTNESSVEA